MSRFLTTLIVSLAMILTARAQDATPTKKPPRFVQCRDGSLLVVTVIEENLTVVTKYGELVIPFEDIHQVDFGVHYPADLKKKIEDCVRNLDRNAYPEREKATKFLQNEDIERFVYPILKKTAQKEGAAEFNGRVAEIMKKIQERAPPVILSAKEGDVVHTAEQTIKGRIKGTFLRINSKQFGDGREVKFSDIVKMYGGMESQKEFTLEAAKYGNSNEWFDTTILMSQNAKLTVTANGQVDLWPQGPGQYMATPRGCNTTGKGGQFMAGTLIGKVGEEGKEFFIGGSYDEKLPQEGKLFVRIVPSPWSNLSSGNYRVRVKVSCAPQ